MMRTANSKSAASANTPTRKRMLCSFIARPSGTVPRQFFESFLRLSLDKLADACVGTLGQPCWRAVKEDLAFARLQAGERMEHDDALGYFPDGLHVVGNDDTGYRVLVARLQDQLVDHITHNRIKARSRFVVKHDFGIDGQ